MAKSDNLRKAKETKNDEFYTRLEDIEAEISSHPDYVRQFKDKVVLCNCDDPEQSNFYEFFRLHFNQLGLKKLITTHYNAPIVETEEHPILNKDGIPEKDKDGNIKYETVVIKETIVPSYKLEWYGEMLNDDTINMIKTPLTGNGDFRSEECIKLLEEADIVVTNPPFSLFREYITLLYKYNKKFVIIGSMNAIAYREVFPLIKNNLLWLGYGFQGGNAYFAVPSNRRTDYAAGVYDPETGLVKFRNCAWFTNLDHDKRHEPIPLTKNYKGNEKLYPSYFNYDAIDVGELKNIPKDYDGIMGVPLTFLDMYCPEQFEIIGTGSDVEKTYTHTVFEKNGKKYIGYFKDDVEVWSIPYTIPERKLGNSLRLTDKDGNPAKAPYNRILIRKIT